jgi:hypothetical protein
VLGETPSKLAVGTGKRERQNELISREKVLDGEFIFPLRRTRSFVGCWGLFGGAAAALRMAISTWGFLHLETRRVGYGN